MLGGLRVTVGDREFTRFQTQKTGALLAYLALHRSRIHARESIAEMLWPDGDPTAIRNRLNQAVSSLRRQLHPPGSEAGAVLVADHHTLTLNSAAVETDVEDFQRHLKLASHATEDAVRMKHLLAAVNLYQGDLLSGYFEDWALTERLYYGDQYADALDRLIKLLVEQSEYDRALELAARRVAADPEDETSHLRLMRLFIRAGRPRSAIKQFEELERMLGAQKEIPSETAYKVLDRAERALAGSDTQEEDEDFTVPAASQAAPEKAPDLPVVRGPVVRLPKFFNRFIGREHELNHVRELLHRPDVRIVTVAGVGGCGKTRLACEAAWSMVEELNGQVYFVSLVEVSDADRLLDEVAKTVASGRTTTAAPAADIAARLNQLHGALVVLDNAEHLVEQGLGDLDALLESAPELKVLITSRQAIGRSDEWVLPLGPLPTPDASTADSLSSLMEVPSVDLFVSRAQAAKQDFQLTERTAEAIAELCRRLEGIPLALELAASWARSMSPRQMVDELTQRLDMLASRRKDIAERHRSMRAAMDSSFALLSDDLQEALVRLSIFRGGWTLEAARSVCPDIDVAHSLAALEERSLIHGQESGDEMRFDMYELIRAFAESRMSPDLAAETGWLHAQTFAKLMNAMSRAQIKEDVTKVGRELNNVVAAIDWFAEHDDLRSALELAVHLSPFRIHRGEIDAARSELERLLQRSEGIAPELEVAARAQLAILAQLSGEFEASSSLLDDLAVELKRIGNRDMLLEVNIGIAHHRHLVGDYQSARKLLLDSIVQAEQLHNVRMLALAWRRLGNTSVEQRNWDRAVSEYSHGLKLARETGLVDDIASCLMNLGNLMILRESYDNARQWLNEAIEISSPQGAFYAYQDASLMLAKLERRTGDFAAARELLLSILKLDPEIWHLRWDAIRELAYWFADAGYAEDAARICGFLEGVMESNPSLLQGLMAEQFYTQRERVMTMLGKDRFDSLRAFGRALVYGDLYAMLDRAKPV